MIDWKPSAAATLIGSMPHREPEPVIDLILREIPEIPVWPQLPFYPAESMAFQYLEGLPGISYEQEDRVIVRTETEDFESELVDFYNDYFHVEESPDSLQTSRFCMGPETGRTFAMFLERMQSEARQRVAVKGQIIGPFTLLTILKDSKERALLYDENFQDVAVKHLAMKARWQISELKELGCQVILFIDEPALAGFGSSTFITVSAELIQRLLSEVVEAIHQMGALAGVHVCANTDWQIIYDSQVDIINFDAYSYFEKFALYRDSFLKFIDNGGIIAWGMVPTHDPEAVFKSTPDDLAKRWYTEIARLAPHQDALLRVLHQSIFTPSCGCGTLPESAAERVVGLTKELAHILRRHC